MNQLQQQQTSLDIIQEAKNYVFQNPTDITLEAFRRNFIEQIDEYTLFYILKEHKVRVSSLTSKYNMINKLKQFLFDIIISDEQVMNSLYNNQSISLKFKEKIAILIYFSETPKQTLYF